MGRLDGYNSRIKMMYTCMSCKVRVGNTYEYTCNVVLRLPSVATVPVLHH